MGKKCYNPDCDGFMYYDTCQECGWREPEQGYARRSGGLGSLSQPLSDEDYRKEMRKLARE